MGITAENVAKEKNVSRAQQDALALASQQKAAAAQDDVRIRADFERPVDEAGALHLVEARQVLHRVQAELDQEGGRVQRFREGYADLPPLQGFGKLYASDQDGALALARKLAQTSGPRAREAAAYARRIQLEHFIWQDEPEASAPENGKPATPDQTAD